MKLYSTPSGLGGSFTIKIMAVLSDDRVNVAVHMPRNPDWHGFEFTTTMDKLTAINNPEPNP